MTPSQSRIVAEASLAPQDTSRSEFLERLESAWRSARAQLLSEQVPGAHWRGQLSTSALSTATAISALALVRKHRASAQAGQLEGANGPKPTELDQAILDQAISVGCHWLLQNQNRDGGFGDTNLSHSNIATSYLVLAAWHLAGFQAEAAEAIDRVTHYCQRQGGWEGLRRRYGIDKTFVVPIMTNCALAGLTAWDHVVPLPFEAAWLPQSWYRLAQMPVVSYAIPALVAIGQARFFHRPPRNPLLRRLRSAAVEPTLRVLSKMQPASGGYLEAVPLTSFVLMSLAATGRVFHPVSREALKFLLDSRLEDGSWPIDTDLATWVTSLSLSALDYSSTSETPPEVDSSSGPASSVAGLALAAKQPDAPRQLARPISPTLESRPSAGEERIRWLLSCQHLAPHPFTGAEPGGWGWSNLSGAVPDADDTPAALIALAKWTKRHYGKFPMLDEQIARAAALGLRWLVRLQNRDGGWPTFCRGWGKLPFDRSGSDLTAHALRAIQAWFPSLAALQRERECPSLAKLERAAERGFRYLARHQRADGSWLPLWFGNQDRPEEDNPIYGTGRVLLAYSAWNRQGIEQEKGFEFLVRSQNTDGGWGGGPSVPYRIIAANTSLTASSPLTTAGIDRDDISHGDIGSSIEETAVALEALITGCCTPLDQPTIMRGLAWLIAAVDEGRLRTSWPIGFYFAKLWYHERLYPYITSVSALGAAVEKTKL